MARSTLLLALALTGCATGGGNGDFRAATPKSPEAVLACIGRGWGAERGYRFSTLPGGSQSVGELYAQGGERAASVAVGEDGSVQATTAPALGGALVARLQAALAACL